MRTAAKVHRKHPLQLAIGNPERLTPAQQIEVGRLMTEAAERGDMDESRKHRDRLVMLLIPWATKLSASRSCRFGISHDEMFSEMVFCLINAADRYDHTKDRAFSTYAKHWFRKAEVDYIRGRHFLIRPPAKVAEKIFYRRFSAEPQEADSPDLAQRIEKAESAMATMMALDLEDFRNLEPESRELDPSEAASQVDMLRRAVEAVESIPNAKWRACVKMRYGLESPGRQEGYDEIGRCIGMSRQHACDATTAGIKWIRDAMSEQDWEANQDK